MSTDPRRDLSDDVRVRPNHPMHAVHANINGVWLVSRPLHPSGPFGWKVRRACHRRGGHWWHPVVQSMTEWFCCACGATREGFPKDGSR